MSTENNNEPENETPIETVLEPSSAYEGTDGTPTGDNTMAMLCHILSLTQFIVPFGNIIGPLILWLVKKDQDAFVDATGKEVLNFQISMTIYALVCFALMFVFIGLILLPILMLVNVVYTIIAAIKANEGVLYKYPFTIQIIK